MPELDEQLNEISDPNDLNDLNEISDLNDLNDLRSRIEKLEKILSEHQHLGKDNSKEFEGANDFKGKTLLLAAGREHKSGIYYVPFNIFDSTQTDRKQRGMAVGMAVFGVKEQSSEQINAGIIAGKKYDAENFPAVQSQFDFDEYNQAQLRLVHLPQSVPAAFGPSIFPPQTFLVGERTPLIGPIMGTITKGGNTLSDSQAKFKENSLLWGVISIFNQNQNMLESYRIIGNTDKTIFIGENGETWQSESGTYLYKVAIPIFLGDASTPFSRLYVGEDIRLGYGTSGGANVRYIKWGYGSPEGKVVANVGSVYLRFDGGAGTTFYVKQSGNGLATGWVGK